MTQAELKSDTELARKVYIEPHQGARFGEGKLLCVLKALYGLTDASDYWHRTLRRFLVPELWMRLSSSYPALYSNTGKEGRQMGLAASQVDDILGAGTDEFLNETGILHPTFE